MDRKLPDGWGRSVINGKEVITKPTKQTLPEDKVIENGKDSDDNYYEIYKDDKNELKLELDPIIIEARIKDRKRKLARAISSKK